MPLKHKLPITPEVDEHGTEWIKPQMSGWYVACCDCGLTHRMQFRVVDGAVFLRAKRAPRYTAMKRRANGEAHSKDARSNPRQRVRRARS